MRKVIRYSTTQGGSTNADGTTTGAPIIFVELRLPDKIFVRGNFEQEVDKLFQSVRADIEAALSDGGEKR